MELARFSNPKPVRTLALRKPKAVKHDAENQTKIEMVAMERLMSPPLSVTTYTQTTADASSNTIVATPLIESLITKKDEPELPMSELSQAFGHSMLESFGRKCVSMHDISDWSTSKVYFMTTFDGNSYRRTFTHTEAMVCTVTCQETFQTNSTNATIVDTLSNSSLNSSFSVHNLEPTNKPPLLLRDNTLTAILSTADVVLASSATETASSTQPLMHPNNDATEVISTVNVLAIQAQQEASLNNINSNDSIITNGSSASSGYDADDELSIEEELQSCFRQDNFQGPHIPPVTISPTATIHQQSVAGCLMLRRRDVSPPAAHSSRQTTLPTVAQVLPHVTGAVIKRIIKRGELKATMSDFS